ncbi:MAG: DMT family transporter, partial [Alphaproteobacteria bacterium]|nr:DMT family transporter [Alphaproteobacteria bacterium]
MSPMPRSISPAMRAPIQQARCWWLMAASLRLRRECEGLKAFAPTAWRSAISARWLAVPPFVRGALLVSLGAFTLTVMALLVKFLGKRLSPLEIQLFRSAVGLLLVMPLFWRAPLEPFRTPKLKLHILRGFLGAMANAFLFWSITHLLLADALALQFSRPLWAIPLAFLVLGETIGLRRLGLALIGFSGIIVYARPFGGGFDVNVLIAACGALCGAAAIITVKKLTDTESTKVIVFHFAFWNVIFILGPAIYVWITPTWFEFGL